MMSCKRSSSASDAAVDPGAPPLDSVVTDDMMTDACSGLFRRGLFWGSCVLDDDDR